MNNDIVMACVYFDIYESCMFAYQGFDNMANIFVNDRLQHRIESNINKGYALCGVSCFL